MKHLSTILLVLSAIISTIAIGVPIWSSRDCGAGECGLPKDGPDSNGHLHFSSGLWSGCFSATQGTSDGQVVTACTNFTTKEVPKPPKDIIVSQVLTISGSILLFGAALLCAMGKKKSSRIVAIVALVALVTVLVFYPVVSLPDINDQLRKAGAPGNVVDLSLHLSVSYIVEAIAVAVGVGGVLSCFLTK